MAYGMEEEDERLFLKGSTTEEGENPTTTVASHKDQYLEEKMMFERRAEHFGVRVSLKITTNPQTEPTQTAKVPYPTISKAAFITVTSKEKTPLDMATGPLTPFKFGISTLKYQGQNLSSHRVEL